MKEEFILKSVEAIGGFQPIFFTAWSSESFNIEQADCCEVRFINALSSTSAIEKYARNVGLNHMQRAYVKLVAFRVIDNKAGLDTGVYLLLDSPAGTFRLVRQRELVKRETQKETLAVVEIDNKHELTMISMQVKDIKPIMTLKKYVM